MGLLLLYLLAPAPAVAAEETIKLQSRVTGNQEQPKVLYIIPWKSPGSSANLQLPLNSQLSALFEHVERSELVRELHYRGQLQQATSSDD
ncbi:MAG: hypothetical protein GYB33_11990 [Gammaproteobacteria bacterium]|nr:hypothetical protein [Gammaproteobacteria bacterium]NHN37765.1 hypothetical protein [Pseudomaricurvus alcaniphilus]